MLLAQLNASQVPYDWVDWLQMAVYFVALPVVAWLGAAAGLVGRWRNGGVLWSTNVGLLGGAVTCLICMVPFVTLDSKALALFVGEFEASYRWQMLFRALAATAGCALFAGAGWRLTHARRDKQPIAFSLSHLLLVQLFALISLGTWISLRHCVLSSVSPSEYGWRPSEGTIEKWRTLGWQISPDQRHVWINVSGLDSVEIADSMAIFSSSDAKSLWLMEGVSLQFDNGADIDIGEILKNPNIRQLSMEFSQVNDQFFQEIGQSNLERLHLFGSLSGCDISPLAKMKSLETLTIGGKCSRTAVNSLHTSQSLRKLRLWDSYLSCYPAAPMKWPPMLEELMIGDEAPSPFDPGLLQNLPALKSLGLTSFLLAEPDLQSLRSLKSIPTLQLAVGNLSEVCYQKLAESLQDHAPEGNITLRIDDSEFSGAKAKHLKQIANLMSLVIYFAGHDDEVYAEIAQISSLTRIHDLSPNVTTQGLMKLANLPKLTWVEYSQWIKSAQFEADFNAQRATQKLERVHFGARMPIAKPASAPCAERK